VITDPVALTNGNVFFTTFEPNSGVCAFGGNLNVWALNYNTGGIPAPATMQGTALVQTSTGAFAEIALSSAFKDPNNNSRFNGRRTAAPIQGMPPAAQGLAVVTNPKPVKKIIHVREK
jgi:type IV pilus assembly protein PilY1